MNFATGAVEQAELDKLDRLSGAMPEGFVKALEFRICLIHHHPLPVVTAEVLPGVAPSGFADKVRSLVTTLTGEHTNMFKNGGTFLLKSLDNRLDLVLHGHQQTLLVLEHPISGEVARRLLVAGAGSAALPVAESYRYCVYTLDVSGNIHVSERMIAVNPIGYEKSPAQFSVYEYEEVRKSRHEKLVEQLEGLAIPDLAPPGGKEIPLEGGKVGGALGVIEFTPPLHPAHPLSLQIEFLMWNAFQFVREYQRGVPAGRGSLEHSVSRSRAVYPRTTTDVMRLGPRQAPRRRAEWTR